MTMLLERSTDRKPFFPVFPTAGTEGPTLAGSGGEGFSVMVVVHTCDHADLSVRRLGSYQLSAGLGTWSPLALKVYVAGEAGGTQAISPVQSAADLSTAPSLVERVKRASGLTLELIAPLAGVSRRTLQEWRAGGRISQRNEERLRALAEAVEKIASVDPLTSRERLMERVAGTVRIYDLLSEQRYESAVARGEADRTGYRPLIHPSPSRLGLPLDAQIGTLEAPPTFLDGRVDRRFTKRLKK